MFYKSFSRWFHSPKDTNGFEFFQCIGLYQLFSSFIIIELPVNKTDAFLQLYGLHQILKIMQPAGFSFLEQHDICFPFCFPIGFHEQNGIEYIFFGRVFQKINIPGLIIAYFLSGYLTDKFLSR